jgi:pyridoxal phosphate enzyme (YggS family)
MLSENYARIIATMAQAAERAGRDPDEVRLVAISKQVPVKLIREAINCGQAAFGENYLQEAAGKIIQLPDTIRWHCTGHLQSNKARQAAELFDVIETVDSRKLALALDRHAQALNRQLTVLIQVNIGREPQKSGVLPEKTAALARSISGETGLRLAGLMTLPPYTDEPERGRPFFRMLRELSGHLADQGLFADNSRVELSMGMSEDYPVAIEEGATIVRVGTALFGERTLQGVTTV